MRNQLQVTQHRLRFTCAVVLAAIGAAVVSQIALGPSLRSVRAEERGPDDRLLQTATNTAGLVFELREFLPELPPQKDRLAAVKTGPKGTGQPARVVYVVRRTSGTRRSLSWCAYVDDWGSRLLPAGASSAHRAALSIDRKSGRVHVVLTKSRPGSCWIESASFSSSAQGEEFTGDSPFPTKFDAPSSDWPSGSFVFDDTAKEDSTVPKFETPGGTSMVSATQLIVDEAGLLLYCHSGARPDETGTPMYARKDKDGGAWRLVVLVDAP